MAFYITTHEGSECFHLFTENYDEVIKIKLRITIYEKKNLNSEYTTVY